MWAYNNELCHYGKLHMKWGVRRYQNKDGTLTMAGKKRYQRDQRENASKKKGSKIGEADPSRWVKDDLERSKKLADSGTQLTNNLKSANKMSMDKAVKNRPKMDLSSMSDKDMRDQINRSFLEKQYNDMFNPKQVSKGRERVNTVLEHTGSALAVTSSALGIALAIKELTGR